MEAVYLTQAQLSQLLHCIEETPGIERCNRRTTNKILKAYERAGGDPHDYPGLCASGDKDGPA